MTSTPTLPEDQLLELLVQLQKTTPDQARAILNAQPTIGYALFPLMLKMGVVNLDVLQKTLSAYAGQPAAPAPASGIAPVPPAVPTIPPHLAQSQAQAPYGHHPTPPPANNNNNHNHNHAAPVYPGQSPAAPAAGAAPSVGASGYPGYAPQAQNSGAYPAQGGYAGQQYGQQQQWNGQQQHQQASTSAAPTAAGAAGMLGALGNVPEDQREMIMRVITMTPEQVRNLPPVERAITVQVRTTLGLPTEGM